ncbi:hypothetical protein PDJAM_G00169090 [Pangasius djambal]|uniref:Uncharacterized protein n=1 Tax=Pangasius djambal TaxID=1691987 RepID=A0ACC5ZLA1_9TELE|nr:hypothetical protein [Pangasius djambal]
MTTDFSELILATELRLVLLGRSGSGKTATQNTILGREERNQAATSEATSTATQQSETTQGEVAGRKVIVVDTPDWFTGSGLSLEKLRQDEGLCVHLSAPGPLVFLLVIPIKNSQDREVYKEEVLEEIRLKMAEIFGKRFGGNIMILFTVTEELQKKSIEEFIQSGNWLYQRLVDKCGNRFHCLNIKERGDGSQVSELLEKIEKMVEGNRNGTEIYQIIGDMERERHKNDAWIVQHEMQKTLETCEKLIKEYENDLKKLETCESNVANKESVLKLKKEHELKRDIGKYIKKKYDRVAGLEENRQFIKVILPENQQPIWLSLPGEQPKNPEKHKELTQLEEWFSMNMGNIP